ncbi:conserved hypothetical protein [Frankia canadensis]|uniref:RiboL-PSP-HEPN domain-containing protein n=1 Tax=Frankia canadensis TaxID=1836972 RepID=A0A2I2L165_9ACTN|nr:conserved hypothetical protein [Frankia canadensis]SOU58951.1 conserved hypothetical protein [Frankia canadensis]
MPSPARSIFLGAINKAILLRVTANDYRLKPMRSDAKQAYYHASLAASVAAWESYVENSVRDFIAASADPLQVAHTGLHSIVDGHARLALKKFNTPTWENSRTLLFQNTGYDPIGDWVWVRRRLSSLAVKARLNEIVQVRHSFAHGFDIPALDWTTSPLGVVRLTSSGLRFNEQLFLHLGRETERGLKTHLGTVFGKRVVW